jgi:hypothetical protein
MRAMTRFFRDNPQAFILLVICIVLGLGTFIAVLIAIGQSGGGTPVYPSGLVAIAGALGR